MQLCLFSQSGLERSCIRSKTTSLRLGHPLFYAGVVTILIHSGLFLLPAYQRERNIEQPTVIHVHLQAPLSQPNVREISSPEKTDVNHVNALEPILDVGSNSVDLDLEKDVVERANVIGLSDVKNWVSRETNSELKKSKYQLQEFKKTFDESASKLPAQREVYLSAMGETHVISKVGNRTVCYKDPNLYVKDDWSQAVVMFYNCPQKDTFKLELP